MSKTIAFTDSPEQAAVINAPVKDDVLVVAGAGSGKTYTMTRRIINLIERGVAPERILGLTFTRKAAGELLSRVSAAVIAGHDGNGVAHAEAGHMESECAASDRMFLKPAVYTYDAFFQTIVRQYGLLVGFDQNTQPLSEAGALQLAANVIDKHMDELRGRDLGAFSTLASRVIALSGAIGSAMIGGDVTDMASAIARVRAWDTAFIEHVREAIGGETVPDEAPGISTPKRLKKDSDETWAAKLREYHERLHALCLFNCAGLIDTAETRDVLLDLVEAYAKEKRRLNMAEFGDFTIAAYQLVTRFPSISERYRKRFSHVLLDEYQDTSTTQAALLATLFHGSGTAVNAVGDPFQSIYAWRGASPGAFRMFQQDFHMPEDTKPFALSVTRRNSRLVLEAANDLTLPLRSAPRRSSSSPMREVDVAPLDTMPDAPEGTIGVLGYDTLGQEIDGVVRFCQAAVRPGAGAGEDSAEHASRNGDDMTRAVGHGGDTPRRTAAVLFRSKKNMAAYQQALERAGLSTLVVGYSAMLDRPEIRDVLALLHVAADHTDAASLMRLLATPRFGFDAETLASLASLADSLNAQARFRALVTAGIASPDTAAGDRAAILREHRDEIANAVFLPDVLIGDDLSELLDHDGRFSRETRANVLRAGRMLRHVRDVVGRPLADVVRTAVQALDLDIDTVLAQALRGVDSGNAAENAVNPTLAHIPMDAVIDLVDTYTAEIAVDSTPTLRGFVAWVDALRSIEDETATLDADRGADVELMTVHQSKGLEWDAVAIVGLARNAFPSNQGDYLSVNLDENHPGGMEQGQWTAPEYRESARTWLDNPTAVPVPVRADAGILPRFPHDAPVGGDPIEALQSLDGVELIDDEVYGSLREVGDGVDDADPDSWHLTQREEFGRRLHADERRLMYVALTRAKRDALLTYSRSSEPGLDPQAATSGRTAKASNFWEEVHDALHARPDAVASGTGLTSGTGSGSSSDSGTGSSSGTGTKTVETLEGIGAAAPDGFFAGDRAKVYEEAVVESAWQAPLERRDDDAVLPWPATLSPAIAERLLAGANEARGMMSARNGVGNNGATTDGIEGIDTVSGAGYVENIGVVDGAETEHAEEAAYTESGLPAAESLLERARLLVADDDLMIGVLEGEALDEAVKVKARRILAGARQSVTSLQAQAGGMGGQEERRYWRSIVRPIPSVASPSASAGTRFHAWAERFIDAAIGTTDAAGRADAVPALTRETMLDDLAQRERGIGEKKSSERQGAAETVERNLLVWQRRFADCAWARRTPAWAERQIVVAPPELGGTIVNGKLDAVFVGGLDENDTSKRFTVIDWKTGRRPRKPKEIAEKLVQLDLYRLLLAAVEGVPLDSIDAALYYVSEPDERLRELRAAAKTEQEIIAELSSGIPEQTDDD